MLTGRDQALKKAWREFYKQNPKGVHAFKEWARYRAKKDREWEIRRRSYYERDIEPKEIRED